MPYADPVHQQQMLHIAQSVFQIVAPDKDGQREISLRNYAHRRTAVPPGVKFHMLFDFVVQAPIHGV